jgi:M6 family metalloprotease-like protein
MRQENTRSRNQVRTTALPHAFGWKEGLIVLAGGLMLLAAVLMLWSGTAWGVSASPDPVVVKQPDGSSITLFLKGDEYFHWNEDATGFPVVRSTGGSWVYAIEQLGQLAPSSVQAGSADPLAAGLTRPDMARLRGAALKASRPMLESSEDRMLKAPAAATIYNLVLLVNFTDLTITSTTQEFNDLFNQVGYSADGATGSVKDYYDEVSYGQLDVVSVVEAPVTVSHGYAYYGANSGGFDIRPREMVAEALAALEARGFDFRSVDGDGDGWIDGLTVIHAGGGEEYSGNDPDYIWSHQWALQYTVTYDGTRMRPYHTEPARRGYDSSPSSWGITRIGVICHETGHFLGLPDLYDTGYDSRGAGNFCIMAGGSWGNGGITPVHFSAWCKYALGWVTPTEITAGGPYSLPQVETNQAMYLLRGPFASTEYYLVENRQGAGFDSSLPGTERGILIWHVDETISNNDDQTHYLCDLEEASGTQDLELNNNSGNDLDYFRSDNATEFTSLTTPDNLSYGGTPLGLDIRMVSESNSLMSFVVNGMSVEITAPAPAEAVDVGDVYRIEWTIDGDAADSVSIVLSIDSGSSYADTITTGIAMVSYYDWTVPNLPVSTARLKVLAWVDDEIVGFDETDGDFTISGAPYRYVSQTGGNIYPYSLPAWAALTIADAKDAAVAGDSIMVAAGTYAVKVSVGKGVYLMGGWDASFTTRDPETNVTTIQANGSTISFVSVPSGTAGIEGFRITGGTGTSTSMPGTGIYGGGVFVYGSPAIIKGNLIASCGYTSTTGFSGGGGIACYNGTVTIEGNEIAGCIAQSGGGIYLYQTTATITGNTISGASPNPSYSGQRKGGGIYALHSDVTMSGNVISGNTGYVDGGGIYADLTPVTSSGDSLYGNSVSSGGGGIYVLHSPLSVTHAFVQGNTAASIGGGIYGRAAQFDLSNSVVAQNGAGQLGGGIYADSSWGGWTGNTVDRNTAGITGGNAMLSPAAATDVRNNIFTYGNTNGFLATSDVDLTYQFNNAFGNAGDDVVTIVPDATNISADPAYADTASLDYHLALHSASVDTGDPLMADPDGSRADQGAFGGPAADFAAPAYVTGLAAVATNDTTITISWDGVTPEVGDYFAVYSGAAPEFTPAESNFVGTVGAASSVFQHYPLEGCNYYRVSYVDAAGYMGGYSSEAGECVAGPDLVAPTVTVASPNGGEAFEPGDTIYVQWIADDNNVVDSVSIYYSQNAGVDFTLLASSEPDDSIYAWVAPDISSDSCLVRVVAYDPAQLAGEDVSDAIFAIKTVSTDDELPSAAFALSQNFPNPFNPATTIQYSVAEGDGMVSLAVYDVGGRLVRTLVDGRQTGGSKSVTWNGTNDRGQRVSSGIYFYRMIAPGFSQTRKMVLLR